MEKEQHFQTSRVVFSLCDSIDLLVTILKVLKSGATEEHHVPQEAGGPSQVMSIVNINTLANLVEVGSSAPFLLSLWSQLLCI